jgi:hypothetical protein
MLNGGIQKVFLLDEPHFRVFFGKYTIGYYAERSAALEKLRKHFADQQNKELYCLGDDEKNSWDDVLRFYMSKVS